MKKARPECIVALALLDSVVKKLMCEPEQKPGITGSVCSKNQGESWLGPAEKHSLHTSLSVRGKRVTQLSEAAPCWPRKDGSNHMGCPITYINQE